MGSGITGVKSPVSSLDLGFSWFQIVMPDKSKYKSSLEESIIIVGLKFFLHISFHRNVKYRIKDKQVDKETRLWVNVSAKRLEGGRGMLLECYDFCS